MDTRERPLSPHLQVYKPQLTSTLSILHRITGVALSAGTLLLVWWLIAAAMGGGAYTTVQMVVGSWIGQLMLFGWSFALFYHLCNGIRHLFWDIGKGLDLPAAYRSGWIVISSSIVLTLCSWAWGYSSMGVL
ncbi:MAG: succinate dehydrogenase, cytochrome b556 subunit [Rhodospirillaceae bacterium]|nr:succinate dehydrogenase, cytochrome b556 subunit [Rhodospirillaceae bacterium]|tara:strand:- start:38537 stop:38932 length:396 start_codon:yes stop_codon:yes gene_type:complete